jgi:hypothetical protein
MTLQSEVKESCIPHQDAIYFLISNKIIPIIIYRPKQVSRWRDVSIKKSLYDPGDCPKSDRRNCSLGKEAAPIPFKKRNGKSRKKPR